MQSLCSGLELRETMNGWQDNGPTLTSYNYRNNFPRLLGVDKQTAHLSPTPTVP